MNCVLVCKNLLCQHRILSLSTLVIFPTADPSLACYKAGNSPHIAMPPLKIDPCLYQVCFKHPDLLKQAREACVAKRQELCTSARARRFDRPVTSSSTSVTSPVGVAATLGAETSKDPKIDKMAFRSMLHVGNDQRTGVLCILTSFLFKCTNNRRLMECYATPWSEGGIYAHSGGFVSESRVKDCLATALRKPAYLAKTEKSDKI